MSRETFICFSSINFCKLRDNYGVSYRFKFSFGEFDLGSGRTLAACLIHASRAREAGLIPSG